MVGPFVLAFGVMLLVLVGLVVVLRFALVHTRASEALVMYAPGREPRVSFRGGLVLPFQSHEIVDLSAKELVLERRGRSSLRCRDSLRADVVLSVSVAVNPTSEDVIHAARALGHGKTHDLEAVRQRFAAKLGAALDEVALAVDYDDLFSRRVEIEDRFVEAIGRDLDGFAVREAHFREVAQTPLESLDPRDVHDAVAIRKLTERAGAENLRTRELREALVRNELDAELATAEARAAAQRAESGYRSDVAAAEARVAAMKTDLEEAERLLDALRGK
jgi:uncharacterized membrane protein YqiK